MAFKLSGVPSASGSEQSGLSHAEFLREWDWVWITHDVEAAAELGRTLLERNRELEATVRQQQALIDDQALEMQYLSKQNRLLRQAAESRLRLCEQLEATVADGERSRARLRHQIDAERQRYVTLKTNLEAAVERGDELQRLLDSSRSAESHARSLLRTLQQHQRQQQQILQSTEEDEPASITGSSLNGDTPFSSLNECSNGQSKASSSAEEASAAAVCQLMDELGEAEERLHQMETDWMDEKKKRIHLESEVSALQQDNHRLQQALASLSTAQSTGARSTSSCSTSLPPPSLSLSEELLISSEFVSAWDQSGPMSLIGALRTAKAGYSEPDEEFSSDSSSSGFSEEGANRTLATKAVQTCHHHQQHDSSITSQDIRNLFRELFDIIHKNL